MRFTTMLLTLSLATIPALAINPAYEEGGQSSGGGKRARLEVDNPKIDIDGYLQVAEEAAAHRDERRVTEEEFIEMSKDPKTIILDARSRSLFRKLHVKGAINLSFPDISIPELQRRLPNKDARILIYCNNNFENDEDAFPGKDATASLNISTYIALYTYGYRNVYELGPLLDVKTTKIPLVGKR